MRSRIHRGQTEVTITLKSGFPVRILCDWEVDSESLDWKPIEIWAELDEETVHYPAHQAPWPGLFLPAKLRRDYDSAIRSALWDEIGPSISLTKESSLVN